MNFINCTPHALTVEGLGTIPSSGVVPRCATERSPSPITGMEYGYAITPEGGTFDQGGTAQTKVRVTTQKMGAVTGLPDPVAGVYLIVSGMVLSALNGTRPDVMAPDTGPDAIRENGQIVAVRGFVQ